MDQFGLLVESTGFKVGRSTPIADLKGKTSINNGFPQNSTFNSKSSSINSFDPSFVDDLDGIFRSTTTRNHETFNVFDDFSAVPNVNSKPADGGLAFDLDSVFNGTTNFGGKTSPSPVYHDVYDILGDFTGSKNTSSVNNDNVFVNVASVPPHTRDPLDDWLGIGSNSNGGLMDNVSSTDDFRLKPPPNGKVKIRNEKLPNKQTAKEKEKPQRRTEPQKEAPKVDFDSIFNMDAQPNHLRPSTKDSVFDSLFPSRDPPTSERTSWKSSETKKVSPSVTNIADDFSFYFEMGGGPSSGNFQEIAGESEERRKSRLKHHQKTQERMVRALHEKTQRDLKVQQEQEERHRLSETLDDGVKRWATGKEGNLRALLSSLQYVLWPECGWQPISLTDLITSSSVKKAYHKATLCVHPDKVQQKGATLQQKYIAEKIFDLLKEAWTKFNKEEL